MNKRNRPREIPLSLVRQIQGFVKRSWPSVVEPDLADHVQKEGGSAKNLIPVPMEIITRHVLQRKSAGASEQEIDREVDFLLSVFQEAADKVGKEA